MVNESNFGIYYSGAISNEQMQGDPSKSLGGYRSSVFISNSMLNKLFDELGISEMNNGQSVYRCIFIKNNHNTESINNLSLYITGKKDFETIKFGISIPNSNESAVQFLNSQESQPFNITWYEAYTEEDCVILKSVLTSNSMIALWINREIQPNSSLRNSSGTLNFIFNWE